MRLNTQRGIESRIYSAIYIDLTWQNRITQLSLAVNLVTRFDSFWCVCVCYCTSENFEYTIHAFQIRLHFFHVHLFNSRLITNISTRIHPLNKGFWAILRLQRMQRCGKNLPFSICTVKCKLFSSLNKIIEYENGAMKPNVEPNIRILMFSAWAFAYIC